MAEPIKPTEGTLKELISRSGYLDNRKRDLVYAALLILMKNHGNELVEDHVNNVLRHLENAKLITTGDRQSVVRKLFSN